LDRICNNLVSNAIKYTPEGGSVLVTLKRDEGETCICVKDSGIGIPDDAIHHLFEDFYRAPNAIAIERQGTGLGLSIVKETVSSFGGRITVESEVGKGSSFTVTLPLFEVSSE